MTRALFMPVEINSKIKTLCNITDAAAIVSSKL